ncbi:hypothetical protein LX15_002448 [Streptoalloteichus tenebrarius]|uniref:Uncharacterized protein n=1 Tax=Streptoalloteichus tenebrarius (strain ATCC 17920 / DSM 40477 / JCM 4838 / CBS 697.72 / NBRC 16177 / NCIMB 11028 / NRRL B-12390 / A12253. 1 / ISP 5477) TaxID=1933 RepID=A0ABT1HT95_STRSD|nr:hypothetical protein [Streptoalloteichus tenebrarius]
MDGTDGTNDAVAGGSPPSEPGTPRGLAVIGAGVIGAADAARGHEVSSANQAR